MVLARFGHVATLLTNGQVLITGGASRTGLFPLTAELYNPSTGKFQRTARPAHLGHFLGAAALLGDGNVLVVGGLTNRATVAARSELFNPTTRRFTVGPRVVTPRFDFPTATTLASGDVLIAGGGKFARTDVRQRRGLQCFRQRFRVDRSNDGRASGPIGDPPAERASADRRRRNR